MSNYVISEEQTTAFDNLKNSICLLLEETKQGVIDIVSNRIYLEQTGEWTVFSGKNDHSYLLTLEEVLTEFACHRMGGENLGLVSIKDQEKFDSLFNGFVELMEIDERFLKDSM
ncbi:MAG: hypothetical protein WC878_01295 [Candidatus Paceibacterota bacterium]|jgi:hypothetical protein